MSLQYFTSIAVLMLATFSGGCSAETIQSKAGHEDVRVLPNDLYLYAKEQGCSQVSAFYKERPEVREPPYVYGVLSATGQSAARDFSAAFWCERPEQDAGKYILLLKLDGRAWPGGCPNLIVGQDFAGGLSVIRDLRESLDAYWNMRDQNPVGKSGQITSGPGIQSQYDGTGNIYYCHEGKWIARPLE